MPSEAIPRERLTVSGKKKSLQREKEIEELASQPAFDPPAYNAEQPTFVPVASSSHATPASQPAGVDNLDFTPSPIELPTTAECIAHLKLLHAFAGLREKVGKYEGAFGVRCPEGEKSDDVGGSNDSYQTSGGHDQNVAEGENGGTGTEGVDKAHSALAERIREKRWTIYVTKAVERFESWWSMQPTTSSIFRTSITTLNFDSSLDSNSPAYFPVAGNYRCSDDLPPLDVLMVWHAYKLNPRAYLEDCIRLTKHTLWRTCFPWKQVNEVISKDRFEYKPPQSAIDAFTNNTFLEWENVITDGYHKQPQDSKELSCPKCSARFSVPWTQPPESTEPEDLEHYLSNDTGYASPTFTAKCPTCAMQITHEHLRVAKFLSDATALKMHKRCLPGTILDASGVPKLTPKGKSIERHDPFFPNRAVERHPDLNPTTLRAEIQNLTIDSIKLKFQALLTSRTDIMLVNCEQPNPVFVAKDSRIAVKKCLSHYWDNSSVFGLDLVGAVLRQGVFVQKMRRLDWYNSPSVVTTCQRLVVKYHRFVELLAENKGLVGVPTLDVDLAWHTHQLSPPVYYSYTLAETNKFLNHDDKIPESTLNTSFQRTARLYESKYGTPYAECTCWYCECTREPFRSSFLNRFVPGLSGIRDVSAMSEKGFGKDPINGVHVSTHNAVTFSTGTGMGMAMAQASAKERRRELGELDLQYAKVCKRYQKSKKKEDIPERRDNDIYIYGAYGYPVYYPVYVPYYSDSGGHDGGHVVVAGGCAAGTCGAGTSLGGCSGGDGTPGCSAGCGGSGGGGGCGSGGGGCGGGGGG